MTRPLAVKKPEIRHIPTDWKLIKKGFSLGIHKLARGRPKAGTNPFWDDYENILDDTDDLRLKEPGLGNDVAMNCPLSHGANIHIIVFKQRIDIECVKNFYCYLNNNRIIFLNLRPYNRYKMTELGLFLAKKSVNKAAISRRTGISKSRLTQLTSNESTKLRADELYLIGLAIDVDPGEMLNEIFKELQLENEK